MKPYKIFLLSIVFLIAFGPIQVAAEKEHQHKPYTGSEAFEKMKQLVGVWEGTMDMGQGPAKIQATYKLTAGGSALVETVFEGMPHEMVSVYHDNASRSLVMTHYCMEQNQPKFSLTGFENGRLTMDLAKDNEFDASKDKHIHALSISFNGKDAMTQQWTAFENGQQKEVVTIAYTRVP